MEVGAHHVVLFYMYTALDDTDAAAAYFDTEGKRSGLRSVVLCVQPCRVALRPALVPS